MNTTNIKKRNPIAKDLKSPKYRMRVVESKLRKPPKHKERYEFVS